MHERIEDGRIDAWMDGFQALEEKVPGIGKIR
jgi:hypothetical protein